MEILGSPGSSPLSLPRSQANAADRENANNQNLAGAEIEGQSGILRQDVFLEVRRLPDRDQELEIAEVREEINGQEFVISVQTAVQEIPLKPEEAAAAQARLDPLRISALLEE